MFDFSNILCYNNSRGDIMISYKPLMVTLAQKGIMKTELAEKAGISSATLARLGKGENVALSVIEKICIVLNCRVEDVVEILPDKK